MGCRMQLRGQPCSISRTWKACPSMRNCMPSPNLNLLLRQMRSSRRCRGPPSPASRWCISHAGASPPPPTQSSVYRCEGESLPKAEHRLFLATNGPNARNSLCFLKKSVLEGGLSGILSLLKDRGFSSSLSAVCKCSLTLS